MRSVGPEQSTANAEGGAEGGQRQTAEKEEKQPELQQQAVEKPQQLPAVTANSTTTNVIPTSPQYGVAIIASETDAVTAPTETVTDTTAKVGEEKELHSTPSRTNDRFKVVKIASLEPFKRGRWKCMDYVDEAPPPTTQASKVPAQNAQIGATMYLQTQSLPQQHIQQMLMQGSYQNAAAMYASGMIPHTQYFYPQGTQQIPNTGMPQQFISTTQPYFQTVVPNSAGFTMPQSYQYVTPNMSAFVPTTQNFQPGQTYAGQPQPPMVNGHTFSNGEQQNGTNLPTQPAKSVILNSSLLPNQAQMPTQNQQQYPIYQQQQQQQQPPNVVPLQQSQGSQTVVTQPPQILPNVNQMPQTMNVTQTLEPNSVYTNPQFVASVNSLPVLEGAESASGETTNEATNADAAAAGDNNPDDPAKTNPVVNAIDNKIEQAMDLVKSHLMYTVREEVEVLKEKIAELMERIQQLETENNYLRSQIPKNQQNQNTGGAPDPPAPTQ